MVVYMGENGSELQMDTKFIGFIAKYVTHQIRIILKLSLLAKKVRNRDKNRPYQYPKTKGDLFYPSFLPFFHIGIFSILCCFLVQHRFVEMLY